MSELSEYDAVYERLSAQATSFTEREALGELWALGEDGWLREDDRFRRTPWGRWIPSDRYLINELAVQRLREDGVSELSLAEEVAAVGGMSKRTAAVCSGDPRLRIEGDRVRLGASELSGEPLLEDAGPIGQCATHLVAERALEHPGHDGCRTARSRCLKPHSNQRHPAQVGSTAVKQEPGPLASPPPRDGAVDDTVAPWNDEADAAGVGSLLELRFLRLLEGAGLEVEELADVASARRVLGLGLVVTDARDRGASASGAAADGRDGGYGCE